MINGSAANAVTITTNGLLFVENAEEANSLLTLEIGKKKSTNKTPLKRYGNRVKG